MSERDRDSSDEDVSSNTSSAGGSSSIRKETPFQPPRQLFDQYQALLSQTIDIPNLTLAGLLPTQPPISGHGDEDDELDGGKTMTKAEKQNAKKKRRKEREREAKQAQLGHHLGDNKLEEKPLSFRLFSSCPVSNIRLEDEPQEYPCPTNPRYDPTSEEEKIHRRVMAESSAVDFPGLGGPSTPAEQWSKTTRTPRPLRATAALETTSNLILIEVDSDHKSSKTTTSIASLSSRAIPLLEAHSSSTTTKAKAARRGRKGKRKRPEATYYRPSAELGGKSQMTLWGHGVGMPVKVKPRRCHMHTSL